MALSLIILLLAIHFISCMESYKYSDYGTCVNSIKLLHLNQTRCIDTAESDSDLVYCYSVVTSHH